MGKKKRRGPSWPGVESALSDFDRRQLLALVGELYRLSPGNRQYLGVRLACGVDQHGPYATAIAQALCPDLGDDHTIDVGEAQQALEDYSRLIGHPRGLAALTVEFVEGCTSTLVQYSSMDEEIEAALLRMYPEALERVCALSRGEQAPLKKRLKMARSDLEGTGWEHAEEITELYFQAFPGNR